MTENNGNPIPPEGSEAYTPPASSAQQAAQPEAGKDGKKKETKGKKPKGEGSGVAKTVVSGIVGAVVAVALIMGLWSFTPVFNSLKGSNNAGSITINSSEGTTTAEAVATKVTSSVVTIYTYSDSSNSSSWSQLFGGSSSGSSSSNPDALGSGVIIKSDDKSSYILTNYHVVEDISKAVVKLGDDQYTATAVGSDSKTDLAVIKIDKGGLTALEWGDSDSVTVGEWVMAIGSPYGYENTCTTGIVSALYRSDVLSSSSGVGSTVYTDMIQTDAAINPGNSGGALVNAEGQLIGINTYISSTSQSSAGLGFAIPASEAKEVAETLMSGETVKHAYLGITMGSSTDPAGAAVTSVYAGTAAAKAGLKTGDVITKIDDSDISSTSDVSVAVSSKSAGDKINITYSRDGKEKTVEVTLGSDSDESSKYADGGEPANGTDSGSSNNGFGNSGNGNGNSGNSGSLGDMLNELFGNGSSNSGNGSGQGGSGSGSGNSGGFWD